MKGILLCAEKVGAYALTQQNRKNKKNVTLETNPTYVTTSHLKLTPPTWQRNIHARGRSETQRQCKQTQPAVFHIILVPSIASGSYQLKKKIKSAHAGTRSLCNFTKHQYRGKKRKKRMLDLGSCVKSFQSINVKRFIKVIMHWLVQLCSTPTKPTFTILNMFKDKVRPG